MKIVLIAIFVALSQNSFSRVFDDRNPPYDRDEIQIRDYSPEMVNWEGRVRCSDVSHQKDGKCSLEFIDNKGKVFNIKENAKLKDRHCKNHKDLLVKLNAEKTYRFLFWGKGIDVKSFRSIRELAPLKKEPRPEDYDDPFNSMKSITIDVGL